MNPIVLVCQMFLALYFDSVSVLERIYWSSEHHSELRNVTNEGKS